MCAIDEDFVPTKEEEEVARYIFDNLPEGHRGIVFPRWPVTMEEVVPAIQDLKKLRGLA